MHTGSLDNNYLTRQAATCRRLAAGIWNDPARVQLLGLAGEYDASIRALRQRRPEAKRVRVVLAFWHVIALGTFALIATFKAPRRFMTRWAPFLRHRGG